MGSGWASSCLRYDEAFEQAEASNIKGIFVANQINDFTEEWCARKKDVLAILDTFRKGDKVSLVTDYDAYKQKHEGVSKLKYNRNAKEAVIELIEKIRPLREK